MVRLTDIIGGGGKEVIPQDLVKNLDALCNNPEPFYLRGSKEDWTEFMRMFPPLEEQRWTDEAP